ncbi:hypothetical protein MRX96_005601 [Rhipicephalus microplus]
MANVEPGEGIPVTSFYSCHRTRSTRLQATTDALFEELDNGNLSDVDGEFDESDDESVVPCAPDQDPVESDTESSDDESALNTSGGWRRKLFKAPDSTYKGDVHEASELKELLSPYEYFKGYVPNSVFLELAEKTNRYSVFHEGSSINTNEAEIRRLVALHLTLGVLHYPRLRLYWKPSMRCDIVASAGLSRNRFEKLRNNLHIVDVNYPDATDRLWKVRPLLDIFQRKCKSLVTEERLCIDEQMVPFKGHLDIKQYVKGKPNPWGIKIFMLCGESGLVYDFLPYQGSTTKIKDHIKQQYGVTGAIVLRLADRIPSGVGHKLFLTTTLRPCHCSVRCWVKKYLLPAL